jgi:hypothetical protein
MLHYVYREANRGAFHFCFVLELALSTINDVDESGDVTCHSHTNTRTCSCFKIYALLASLILNL